MSKLPTNSTEETLPGISLLSDEFYAEIMAYLLEGKTPGITRNDGSEVYFELRNNLLWEMPTDVRVARVSDVILVSRGHQSPSLFNN